MVKKRKFKIGDEIIVCKSSGYASAQRTINGGELFVQKIKAIHNDSMPYETKDYFYRESDIELTLPHMFEPNYELW